MNQQTLFPPPESERADPDRLRQLREFSSADARRDAHAKPTQRDRVLNLLREANGEWVSLTRILELRIAQFGARILELRRAGHNIENRTEEVDGETHSWYRLVKE